MTLEKVLACEIVIFKSFFQRFLGLMGKRTIAPSTLFVLEPCSSIHTFWMRVPLDVLFLDENWQVLAIYWNVQPGKILSHKGAFRVIECDVGQLETYQIEVGDRLKIDLLSK